MNEDRKEAEQMKKWLQSQKHLPLFLRDFGTAGWLFRWIDKKVEKRRNDPRSADMMDDMPTSRDAHIYVIDFFLWFMAMYGWTLQRSRKRLEFDDIETMLEQFEQEERNAFYAILHNLDTQKENEQ